MPEGTKIIGFESVTGEEVSPLTGTKFNHINNMALIIQITDHD